MLKSKPFTIRLSEEVGRWLERENRRIITSAQRCLSDEGTTYS